LIHILNAESLNYSDEARQVLQSIGDLDERQLDRAGLLACISDYDALIVRLGFQVDREMLDAATCLKAIVTATTGLDHIDTAYAARRGIEVLSLRGEIDFLRSIPATAEHTWALLLALIRRIPQAAAAVRAGAWDRDAWRGHDLHGRRLGILGLGRIGEKVACYGLAFGMAVAAFDPYRGDWLPDVQRCSSLDELLRQADVLSLHVPLNNETCYMIGARELALLPAGAVVINTARGAALDGIALVESLRRGHLAGAALDVIEDELDEDQRRNSPLLAYARQFDNLLITPHIGGATFESMACTESFMAQKLKRWLVQQIQLS